MSLHSPDEKRDALKRKEVVSRADFEALIESCEKGVDELIGVSERVQEADLHAAEQHLLLKRIAKLLGVPIESLRKTSRNESSDASANIRDEWLEDLNQQHAVAPISGKVLIMNQEYDPALDRNLITFSSRQDFVLRYENQKTFIRGNSTSIGDAWLGHSGRRQYDGIVFAPGKDVPGYFNLFQGFGVEPSEGGSCDLFLEMIADVICDGNSELFAYVWGWLAHIFQRPSELPGTSLVLRGKQGTGKNTFVDAIGNLVGKAHYISLTSMQQVTGRFSGHLADALLVFANEAIWGGDKSAEGTLKAMVTDSLSAIERKKFDIVAMRNYKRLVVASNEDWIIPRGMDDRRFIIIDVSDAHKEDLSYFKAIKKQLGEGGFAALMYALLQADISKFDPRNIPETVRQSGWELKIRSGGSVLQWWFSIIDRGYLADGDEYLWPDNIEKSAMHRHYLKWCEQHRIQHPEVECVVGKKLREWGLTSFRPRDNGDRIRRYRFGALDDMRERFAGLCGIPPGYWADPGG